MNDDNELQFSNMQTMDPQAQAIAVREMAAAVVSRRRWSAVENVAIAICLTACFCTTCVTCFGGP